MTATSSARSLQERYDELAAPLSRHDDDFKYLIDSAADGVIVQQDRHVVYANPRAIAQFGATHLSQIDDRPLCDFVAPEDRPSMMAFRQQLLDDGGFSGPQTFRRIRLDGSCVELVVVAAKITWQDRPALLGILRNATWRERIQISLNDSELLRESVSPKTDRSLWETDSDHRFTYLSEEFGACGIPPSQMIGKTLWEVAGVVPQTSSTWREFLSDLDARRPFVDFEYSFARPDGAEVQRSVSGIPNFDAKGEFAGYRGSCQDITRCRQAERTIEHMALHDALTGLPNRFYLSSELERACTANARQASHFAVLFLDLDHFKDINDTLGHSVGDKLLIEAASRLRRCLRGPDLIARFGGDEFVMIVEHDGMSGSIDRLADRLTKATAVPYRIDGLKVHSAVSIGIAMFPEHGTGAERLLAHADLALYSAKRGGRNTWRIFDFQLQEQLQAQRSLDEALRVALERKQFQLHYQPMIATANGQVHGLEALVRWNRPAHGQVMPKAFIPAAEQYRHVVPLTEWILQEAAEQHRRWAAAGLGCFNVAVNVPPTLLKLQSFVDLLDQSTDRAGCDPSWLTIEITEGNLFDEDSVVSVLTALRSRGVTIAVDDFGKGFASMMRLKTLPIDVIKIERSLFANVPGDGVDAMIVESLVNVAHGLGKRVVAEGVETRDQFRFLETIGCDVIQGFVVAQPMPATEIASWLRRWPASRCAQR